LFCAPDQFPKRDFLRDDEQLTLDKAFDEIERGLQFVTERISDEGALRRLRECLDASLAAFRVGDRLQGSRLLQQFKATLLENLGKRRSAWASNAF
jgi:hypothetical protein